MSGVAWTILLAFLAVAAATAGATEITVCTQAECDCSQPSDRSAGRSFTKTVGRKICVCICGSDLNEKCKSDGECVSGTYCKYDYVTADANFSGEGKCTSNCHRTVCPQFHECAVDSDGVAKCECSRYSCDNGVLVPLCAAAPEDRVVKKFNNTCLYVNENCDRKQKGLSEMKSFVCMNS